jgi:hypothetical protein
LTSEQLRGNQLLLAVIGDPRERREDVLSWSRGALQHVADACRHVWLSFCVLRIAMIERDCLNILVTPID